MQAQDKNIQVEKLYTDQLCSSFKIMIRDSVRLHYHTDHTENIFVNKGTARMQLDTSYFEIKKGDHFTIPKGTKHAVWVSSSEALEVISIQSPEFKGKDRHFINE